MNIVPMSKGLVTGLFRFRFLSSETDSQFDIFHTSTDNKGQWFDCSSLAIAGGSMSITTDWSSSRIEDIDLVVHESVKYLLVIEKEGVFRRLVEDNIFSTVPCIICTGSGFPDVATRAFVSKVSKLTKLTVLGTLYL
jgi:DNA topoisomerase VI subunit A